MKLKLYISSKQIDYFQQLEIFMEVLKKAFGSSESSTEADIINNKIKSLPVLSNKDDIAAFFQRNT